MQRIGEFMGPSPFRDRAPRPTASEKLTRGINACTSAVMHFAEMTVAAVHHTPNQVPEPTAVVMQDVRQSPQLQEVY